MEFLWFRREVEGGVGASVELGRKRQNYGVVFAICKLPKVPVILFEGDSTSLSKARSQGRQFLAAWYPADLEDFYCGSWGRAEYQCASLHGEADWNLGWFYECSWHR